MKPVGGCASGSTWLMRPSFAVKPSHSAWVSPKRNHIEPTTQRSTATLVAVSIGLAARVEDPAADL
jgi:hypothetical protein